MTKNIYISMSNSFYKLKLFQKSVLGKNFPLINYRDPFQINTDPIKISSDTTISFQKFKFSMFDLC